MLPRFPHSRKGIQGVLVTLILLAAFVNGGAPRAQAQGSGAPNLFGDAGANAASLPSYAARSHNVTVNLGLLLNQEGKALDVSAKPRITFNLFPDVNYTGVIQKVEAGDENSYSWVGTLENTPNGYFYLVAYQGVFVAHIASNHGVYEVSSAGKNLYRVDQIDQSRLGGDAPVAYDPPGEILAPGSLGPEADSGSVIDIMVVYTPAARAAEGSATAMKARIALALQETNTSYANSGVTPRLRLVHVQEMSYTETGNITTDLARLTNTSDGYLDTVHTLRNRYGADMVALIVENGGDSCGAARAIMATAATAFQVTTRPGCMTGYYSFGHQFGHLQGARHDTYVDPTTTPYVYGHGYVHTGPTASSRWRTIMAEDNKCASLGYSCTRLQYWSNPSKTYGGAAMGNTGAKNYMVLNNTAFTVANFRAQIIANNFNSTFNANATGWSPVSGTWSLVGSAYYKTDGLANLFATAKHAGTYGNLTYEVRMKRAGCTTCANSIIIHGKPTSLATNNLWKPSYLFEYQNSGLFSVYKVDANGTATALKVWTTSSAIVKNGWNTLKVIAVGTTFKFYINGTLVWTGNSPYFSTGQVGFGMSRDGTSTGNALWIDWAKLTTTATAAFDIEDAVAPGVEVPGGTVDRSP